MNRPDLTNWILHFVHRRNPDNDPFEFSINPDTGEYVEFPEEFTYDGEPMYKTNRYEEEDYGLPPDAYGFEVLLKILHDGYIRTGWSFRNFNPTIYGPKPAVCFTEMPLYGLIEYAKKRNNEYYTENYGIAFLRDELFIAGARPVFYGLSTPHRESISGDINHGKGLRNLAESTGIGLKEQYRYVYTRLGSQKSVDWTHEREWRWADINEHFDFAGMPLFAKNEQISFSQIIVFVKTKEERETTIDHLKNLYHSKSTNFALEYNLNLIQNTYVLALDEVDFSQKKGLIKFDDLPLHRIPKIEQVEVSPEILQKVKLAVEKASELSYAAVEEFDKKYGDRGGAGYSHVITWNPNSEITQALINLDLAHTFADGYYHISDLKPYPIQSIDANEAGAKAAAEFLNKELGNHFSYRTRWD